MDIQKKKLAKELIFLFSLFEKRREVHHPRWKELAEYLLPDREIFMYDADKRGMITHSKIFNGIGQHALQVWGDGMLGYIASPVYPWQRYKMPTRFKLLNDVPEIKVYLQDYEEAMYDEFKNGGLYKSLGMMLRDGGSIGMGYIYPAEHSSKRKLVYKIFHPWEMYIGINEDGDVDTHIRKYNITARNALKFFGEENLTKDRVKLAKDNPLTEFPVLWIVLPREEHVEGLKGYKNKPFASFYIDIKNEHIMHEGGYDSLPVVVYRCMLASGEDYARSPGSQAVQDVKMTNLMSKVNLTGAQKAVESVMELPIELRGKVDLNPGGKIWRPEGVQPGMVRAVDQNISMPAAVDMMTLLENRVKRHYFYDFFLSLLLSDKERTAFETAEILGEKATVLAPIIYQFLYGALDNVIYRSAHISLQAGRLPKAPDILYEMGADHLDIEYMGPLAKAQARLFKTRGIQGFMESAMPISDVSPSAIMHRVNWDEIVEDLADAYGIPEKDIRTDEEVRKIREQEAKLKQMMQQAEMAKVGAEAGQRMSATPQPGSPMEAMMNAGGVVPGA